MEIWKDIEGYEGLYKVSNMGRIKSMPRVVHTYRGDYISKEKILTSTITHDGYAMKQLYKNGEKKFYFIHRLVATAFIKNPLGLPFINHKNENKADNRVENLEWCDAKYNINYGTCIERRAFSQRNTHNPIPVEQRDLEGNIISKYNSLSEASRETGILLSNIWKCCKNIQKTTNGYKWNYA